MKKFILLALLTIYGDGLLAQSMGLEPIDGPAGGPVSLGHYGPFDTGDPTAPIGPEGTANDRALTGPGDDYETGIDLWTRGDVFDHGPMATRGSASAYEPDFYEPSGFPRGNSDYPMTADMDFDDDNGPDGMQPTARSRFAWGEEELSSRRSYCRCKRARRRPCHCKRACRKCSRRAFCSCRRLRARACHVP